MAGVKFIISIGLLLVGGLLFYCAIQKKSSLKLPEEEALQNLIKIYQASWHWKNTDVDFNSRKDFWTRDIAALYYYKKQDGKSAKLIPKELALADLDPRSHYYMNNSFKFLPYRGYGYKMIQYDAIGLYYAIADPATKFKSTNLKHFGILAFPQVPNAGLKTFIMNEKSQVFSKLIQHLNEADKWPGDPQKAGWEPIQLNR